MPKERGKGTVMREQPRENAYLTAEEIHTLEKLVGDYRPGLVLYLNGIVRDFDTAEDLAEDCFVILMQKKPSFPNERAAKSWLFKVGRNLAVNRLRHDRKIVPAGGPEDLPEVTGEDTEEMLLRKEFWEELYRAMLRLKTEYAQVLWLTSGEGMSAAEVGRVMGLTKRQAESMLYRARRALQKELDILGGEKDEK